MLKIAILVTITAITSLLCACGGGGGDGSDATNVSGVWRGALTKISDNCSQSGPVTINVTHQVNQNEDAINLQAESGLTFLGNTVGENGFSVDGSHGTIGSNSCTDQSRIEYDSVNDDDDPTADIDITINRSCTGDSTCSLEYTGVVSRISGGSENTAPTPVAATTPVSGGCSQINPNPAAGTYSGDGGCGISDSTFSTQANVVILEPFGSNALTSFNIDGLNSALALSQSTDLTILGQAGYSCSITCSPPISFTVKCVKEGATSCIEKF